MNWEEAKKLYDECTEYSKGKTIHDLAMFLEFPDPRLYDTRVEGCKLWINALLFTEETFDQFKFDIENIHRHLNYVSKMFNSEKYYVVYKPRYKPPKKL